MVIFCESGCIREKIGVLGEKVVLFVLKLLYSGKVAVFGQKCLYSGKVVVIRKMVGLGQKWV